MRHIYALGTSVLSVSVTRFDLVEEYVNDSGVEYLALENQTTILGGSEFHPQNRRKDSKFLFSNLEDALARAEERLDQYVERVNRRAEEEKIVLADFLKEGSRNE